MILATNSTNYKDGAVGLVESVSGYLNDRKLKYWSKAEIVHYLNLEQLKIASALNTLYETHFIKSATTTTVASQSLYSMPTDMVQFLSLEIGDNAADTEPQELVEVHYTDRKFYKALSDVNNKRLHGFFFIKGNDFEMEPGDSAGGKTLRVFYVERLVDLLADGTDDLVHSKIPKEHHDLLALGSARRGRAKLRRGNPEIDKLYREALQLLHDTAMRVSPQREERRDPYYGTYGPDPLIESRLV